MCNTTSSYNSSVVRYKWKRGNELVSPNNRYIVTNSLLIIVNLTTADAGHYYCTIYDSVKRQITINTIQVIINGKRMHMWLHIWINMDVHRKLISYMH